MAKEVSGFIKLQIRGGQANPSPPVGPALGAKGRQQRLPREKGNTTGDHHTCKRSAELARHTASNGKCARLGDASAYNH